MSKDEIRKLLGSEKLLVGTERTMKALNEGTLQKVYVAANLKESVKEDLERFSQLSRVEIVQTSLFNDELGVLCKKPFSISMLGVLK